MNKPWAIVRHSPASASCCIPCAIDEHSSVLESCRRRNLWSPRETVLYLAAFSCQPNDTATCADPAILRSSCPVVKFEFRRQKVSPLVGRPAFYRTCNAHTTMSANKTFYFYYCSSSVSFACVFDQLLCTSQTYNDMLRLGCTMTCIFF